MSCVVFAASHPLMAQFSPIAANIWDITQMSKIFRIFLCFLIRNVSYCTKFYEKTADHVCSDYSPVRLKVALQRDLIFCCLHNK